MAKRVLLVCLGNICRSPAAEAVLRRHAPHLELDSAGTGAWHAGLPPDPRAQAEGRRRGYRYDDLRARKITRSDYTTFDLILGMDRQNIADIEEMAPAGTTARIALFLDDAEVPDPYYDDSFPRMFDLIEKRARELAAIL